MSSNKEDPRAHASDGADVVARRTIQSSLWWMSLHIERQQHEAELEIYVGGQSMGNPIILYKLSGFPRMCSE